MNGGCHCGAIRFSVEGTPRTHALCHCTDCRRHAGAPIVAWAMFPREAVRIEKGSLKIYKSSEHGRRHFCPDCGTGLFYMNEKTLPGIIDVKSATLDDPGAFAPAVQIQVAECIAWMMHAHDLPSFDRYPTQS